MISLLTYAQHRDLRSVTQSINSLRFGRLNHGASFNKPRSNRFRGFGHCIYLSFAHPAFISCKYRAFILWNFLRNPSSVRVITTAVRFSHCTLESLFTELCQVTSGFDGRLGPTQRSCSRRKVTNCSRQLFSWPFHIHIGHTAVQILWIYIIYNKNTRILAMLSCLLVLEFTAIITVLVKSFASIEGESDTFAPLYVPLNRNY